MKTLLTFISTILLVILTSCSSVDLVSRSGKDIMVTDRDFERLKGQFSNQPVDTSNLHYSRALFENLTLDTTGKKLQSFFVDIKPLSETQLQVNLYAKRTGDETQQSVKSIVLKGKFKRGYFVVNRQHPVRFIAGPIVWSIGERQSYIGLTKENNLVVLDSGGKGIAFLLLVPVMVAGGDNFECEYNRRQ